MCRHVRRCHNLADVARLGEGSKVVLVTGLSMEGGLSRDLLVKWGADSRNAVIVTQQPPVGHNRPRQKWCIRMQLCMLPDWHPIGH
jgi:Cft2 family RNA processing exonuclease